MAIAVRIARAATHRDKIALCGYHGWHDWYVAANLRDDNTNQPHDDPRADTRQLDRHLLPGIEPHGVPHNLAGTVATFSYNRLDELEAILDRHGDEFAAVVMEPSRSVDPVPGFLEGVRRASEACGAVLIFDEISSGWRHCVGGIHRLYGVEPDVAVFAKALSNGYAMGAVIGRRGTMQAAETSFISSTYWTEGIGPASALATVRKMLRCDVPRHLQRLGEQIQDGWRQIADRYRLPLRVTGRPTAPSFQFEHALQLELMTSFTTSMLDLGILACGNCSLTFAHRDHHVQRYLAACDTVFRTLAEQLSHGTVREGLRGPVRHSGFRRLVD